MFTVGNYLLTVRGVAPHDDGLFLRLARNILMTGWLGPYDHFTLIKGPGYPLLVALNMALGLPLLLTQNLIYMASAALLGHAVARAAKNRWIGVITLGVVLFHPIAYVNDTHNVLRTSFYMALTLVMTASFILVDVSLRDGQAKRALRWALAAGVTLSLFWLTREEGVWVAPVLGVFVLAAGWVVWRNRQAIALRKGLAVILLPFAIWLGALLTVSLTNWVHYGFFGTSEFKSDAYLSAYGALVRVDHPQWRPNFPVPESVRNQIYAVSPAFAELRESLEHSGFKQAGCSIPQLKYTCGDFAAGWFLFALIDSVAAKGYYASGDASRAFYHRLADEVNAACDNGRLPCSSGRRASMVPPLHREFFDLLPERLRFGYDRLIRMETLSVLVDPSVGTEFFPFVTAMTNNPLAPPMLRKSTEAVRVRITGWVYHSSGPLTILIEGEPGEGLYSRLQRIKRPDIVSLFKDPNADRAGYDMVAQCEADCRLVFRLDDGRELRLPLPHAPGAFNSNGFSGHFDRVAPQAPSGDGGADVTGFPSNTGRVMEGIRADLRTSIRQTYTAWFPPLFYGALIVYGLMLLRAWRRRREALPPLLLVIATAALAGAASRMVMLSVLDLILNSYVGMIYGYIGPSFQMITLFVVASLAGFALEVFRASKIPRSAEPVS
jgi:hypothetical protein